MEGPEEDPNLLVPVGYAFEPSHGESQPPLYVATRCQAVEDPEEDPNRLATVGSALRLSHREAQQPALCSHPLPSGVRSRGKPPTVGCQLAKPLSHRMVKRNPRSM